MAVLVALVCAAALFGREALDARSSGHRGDPLAPAVAHRVAVPILMYHVVAPPPPRAPFPDLYVERADFARQMRWLASHGFHGVTLRQVYDYWHGRATLPRKPVVVSFDDGYRSVFRAALPVLRALHWHGVVNLKVGNTRAPSGLPPRLVRYLIAAGWEIDAHTFTHPDLTTVDARRLRYEVAGSRKWIRRTFHVSADFFCYPSGRYDARVVAAVRAAGYLGATRTGFGLARPDELYALDRVRVNGSDSLAEFASKLRSS